MEVKTRILLAEDDENLGMLLTEYLAAKSYETDWVKDGEKAFKYFQRNPYHLCIIDVMMPVKDGFTLAREIREINKDIPILFLTAKSLKEDIIEGFSIGADDYLTKPFDMDELVFRIEAILKRTMPGRRNEQTIYSLGRYTFDYKKQILTDGKKTQKLTGRESDLLKLLCDNKNSILERNFALRSIWTDNNYFNARSMDVYITKLRKYLKDEPAVEILNIHGKGFKLIAP